MALGWQPADQLGVWHKLAGIFPHRGLGVTCWKTDAGAEHVVQANPALRFLFVTGGYGSANASELRRWSVLRLSPGEAVTLATEGGLEWVELEVTPVARP